jgi:hypothetical protein
MKAEVWKQLRAFGLFVMENHAPKAVAGVTDNWILNCRQRGEGNCCLSQAS